MLLLWFNGMLVLPSTFLCSSQVLGLWIGSVTDRSFPSVESNPYRKCYSFQLQRRMMHNCRFHL